jgi:hypothetical protein
MDTTARHPRIHSPQATQPSPGSSPVDHSIGDLSSFMLIEGELHVLEDGKEEMRLKNWKMKPK